MIYTLVRRKGEQVDAVISFSSISSFDESWTATVTTQTVERGFNITDNINIEPPTYDISAVISSYSIFSLDKEISWNGEDFVSSGETNALAHVVARDEIIDIFKSKSILTIIESTQDSDNADLDGKVSELKSSYNKEIDNCIINSLSISNPDSATGSFYVAIKLQKIFVATVLTAELSEEEMIPALVQMKVKETEKASSTSTTTDEDGNTVAIQEPEFGTESSSEYVGMTDAEGFVKRNAVLVPIQNEVKATEFAQQRSAATRQNWKPVFKSGAWYIEPTG